MKTGIFIIFGMLSDRIGRKWIILGGCILAAATYFPLFKALTHFRFPRFAGALGWLLKPMIARKLRREFAGVTAGTSLSL